MPVLLAGVLISSITYLDGSRLPASPYLAFGLVQLVAVATQINRRNLLTAVFGLCLTLMLLMAADIELAPHLAYNGYLTSAVYTPRLIALAYSVLLCTSSVYHLLTLWFVPHRQWRWRSPDRIEQRLADRLRWVFLVGGTVMVVITVPGSPITDAPYASALSVQQAGMAAEISGLSLLGIFLLSFAIVAAVRAKGYASLQFKLSTAYVIALVAYFRLLRGDRGGSLGVFITLAFVFYMSSKKPKWQKNLTMLLSAVLLFGFLQVWAAVRAEAHASGVWTSMATNLSAAYPDLSHPLDIQLLPQSYWHLLHTIDLYTSGISLNGRTVPDLVLQSIPSFIADAFHYERPLNGAWLLASYRINSGGIYVIAEGFWNFGMVGALVVAVFLATLAIKLEAWYRNQHPVLASTYFAFLGTFGFGLFYGVQPLVKSLEVALVIAWFFKSVEKWYRRRAMSRLAMLVSRSRFIAANHQKLNPVRIVDHPCPN